VINDEVARAVADLQNIILAERTKPNRQTEAIQAILDSFDASKILHTGD
jgi:guanylate kinase